MAAGTQFYILAFGFFTGANGLAGAILDVRIVPTTPSMPIISPIPNV